MNPLESFSVDTKLSPEEIKALSWNCGECGQPAVCGMLVNRCIVDVCERHMSVESWRDKEAML